VRRKENGVGSQIRKWNFNQYNHWLALKYYEASAGQGIQKNTFCVVSTFIQFSMNNLGRVADIPKSRRAVAPTSIGCIEVPLQKRPVDNNANKPFQRGLI
jgi:hypothetical protein